MTSTPTRDPGKATAAALDLGSLASQPDPGGHFGDFGGVFVPETLHAALDQLAAEYDKAKVDPKFKAELSELNRDYVGRPTPLQFAARLTEKAGGARIYLKREDLAHTGAHKINNSLGQALLSIRMGKSRVIAETGAGQHGVATATACARLGLKCEVFMGTEDMRRQRPNVQRMKLMGAEVVPVESGSRTLKDATNAAMRDWMETADDTHYIIGSVVGPHPFPMIVRDFQSVMGTEARAQFLAQFGQLPDHIVACVGGGSNAACIFFPSLSDDGVKLYGVEAGGRSTNLGDHAAPLTFGTPGVLHGSRSYVLQDDDGQTMRVHSCSAGLDYPGVGPEHSYWHDTQRATYTACTDADALKAFTAMTETEGIIPALETAHAIAYAMQLAAERPSDETILINVSGRGDKDLDEAVRLLGMA
ncbi:MAG: tryptophan synthase subunit beta [Phycisphaeraceae bacterium]